MYNRLTGALPQYRVMAQVSFGALLTAKVHADRNRFDRKIADFVVCDASLTPIAVIELDDASHANKTTADAARDKLLADAGYRVLRYANVPDIAPLQAEFLSIEQSTQGAPDANHDEPSRKGPRSAPGAVLARAAGPQSKRAS